jgi:hypothetical protein
VLDAADVVPCPCPCPCPCPGDGAGVNATVGAEGRCIGSGAVTGADSGVVTAIDPAVR